MLRSLLVCLVVALTPCLAAQQVFIGSPDQVPTNSPAVGQLDYIVFGFGAQKAPSAAATVTLSSLTVANLGTAQTTDWVRIRLIKDSNTNATVDPQDVVLSSVLATGFPLTFPPLPPGDTIPAAPAASIYLIAVDIAAGAVLGRTFQLQIAANTSFVTSPAQTIGGAPITGNLQTIAAASTAEMDIQRVTSPPTSIAAGGTDNVGNRAFGTPLNLTWTVLNTGTQNLTLQGAPQIFIPTFAVVNCTVLIPQFPAASVPPSGQTTFTLQINVLAAGPFGFIARIDNNDANENAYAFVVTGVGALPPEMGVSRAAAPIADGGADTVTGAIAGVATVLTYTINNTGAGPLALVVPVAAPGAVTNCTAVITTQPAATVNPAGATSLVLSVTPGAPGAFGFTISIGNDDSDENPYNWTVSGNAVGPEIDVFRTGGPMATPLASGGSDARGTLNGGQVHVLTYEVRNTGLATLSLPSGVAISGQTNCTAVAGALAVSVNAAGAAGLAIDLTPGANGPFSFNVSIANNDSNENPYTWTVSGTSFVPQPEMDVLRGGVPIANAAADPIGNVASFVPLNLIYTIENTGTAALDLTGTPVVAVTPGVNVTAAALTTQPSNTIAVSGITTFTLSYTVGGAGAFSIDVSIDNNDLNENPYTFTISGTGLPGVPEIELTRAGVPVVDGGNDSLGAAAVPVGVVVSLSYAIGNLGTGPLTITVPVTITGQVNCTVMVLTQPGTSVAPSASTPLVLEVTPSSGGAFNFTVSVDNNDANENPYNWTVSGTAAQQPAATGGTTTGGGSCAAGPGGMWILLVAAGLALLCLTRRVQRLT